MMVCNSLTEFPFFFLDLVHGLKFLRNFKIQHLGSQALLLSSGKDTPNVMDHLDSYSQSLGTSETLNLF